MDKNNQAIRVEIYGQTYQVRGDASNTHILDVAKWVDTKMREIGKRSPNLDHTKVAVLTAINIADELLKVRKELEEIYHMLEEEEKK